ncbi:MAG: flagellar biosynthesis regulator FlaF [Desulfosarcina sp.]|nr:flagellar biosynthesis regulator FlaF [Desulfobacterales bacterium]
MSNNPLNAYKIIEQTTISGRETEARVLNKAAQKLKNCQDTWKTDSRGNPDSTTEAKLDEALNFNQRLWSIFQAELSKHENPLPVNLKQDLLRLSAFIDKRIFEVLAYPARDNLAILIKINQNIAAGLNDSAQDLTAQFPEPTLMPQQAAL